MKPVVAHLIPLKKSLMKHKKLHIQMVIMVDEDYPEEDVVMELEGTFDVETININELKESE